MEQETGPKRQIVCMEGKSHIWLLDLLALPFREPWALDSIGNGYWHLDGPSLEGKPHRNSNVLYETKFCIDISYLLCMK